MMTSDTRGSVRGLLLWQWRNVAIFATASALAVAAVEFGEVVWRLPVTPLAVVGGALGIFVSFRTNAGYDRWWEGRKLWGRMINSSRHFAKQVLNYIDEGDREAAERIVRRHIAYVHTLKALLRKQDPFADESIQLYLGAELEEYVGQSNMTHALLDRQTRELNALRKSGLTELVLQRIDLTVEKLLDIQGGCERIKGTPVPPGYGFIAQTLIRFYSVLLPFALVDELHWWTVPIVVLVCLSFMLISEAGRVLEDPFDMFWNALPLMALSRKIEVNLLHVIGEDVVPEMIKADEKGILM